MAQRLPPLNSLRAFESAARHLSFKKAAGELAVTPTAISHQIRVLEEFLGLTLFRRLTRSLTLTADGEAMLPKLKEGFVCLAAAVDAVRMRDSGGVVTVCAPPSFAARWLIPRLGHFSRAHPDVDLRLSSSLVAVDNRDAGTGIGLASPAVPAYDLMIRFGRGAYPGCIVEPLFSPAYVAVCSPALLSGEHPLRVPADLRWHTLIHDATVADFDERPGWSQWLAMAGVGDLEGQDRGPRFQDAALAVEAAIAGHGVALAARPLVSADIAVGRLAMPFPQSIPSRYAYYVTTPEAGAQRPAVAFLRRWLVREAERERLDESGAIQAVPHHGHAPRPPRDSATPRQRARGKVGAGATAARDRDE